MARSQTFERRSAITALVRRDGIVSAQELRKVFSASPMTIRRDLDALEQAGVLARVHGGAVRPERRARRRSTRVRPAPAPFEGAARVAAAARSIGDHEIVFLDPSPAALHVADVLARRRRPTTIVTNGVRIADRLARADATSIDLILVSGLLLHDLGAFVGPDAEAAVAAAMPTTRSSPPATDATRASSQCGR